MSRRGPNKSQGTGLQDKQQEERNTKAVRSWGRKKELATLLFSCFLPLPPTLGAPCFPSRWDAFGDSPTPHPGVCPGVAPASLLSELDDRTTCTLSSLLVCEL